MKTLYAHENLIEKIEGLDSFLEASDTARYEYFFLDIVWCVLVIATVVASPPTLFLESL